MSDRRFISVADTAKLVRAALKKAFPGVKFSVRSRTYAGGASIDVGWTDGPLASQVEAIAKNYQGGGFDGMIDMAYSVEAWLLPDGSACFAKTTGTEGSKGVVPSGQTIPPSFKAERVRFGADYVFCNREYSAGMYRRAVDKVCRENGLEPIGVKDGYYPSLESDPLVTEARSGRNEFVSTLVHRDLVRRTNYVPAGAEG